MARVGPPGPGLRPVKANYGNVAEHPELVDINYWEDIALAIEGGLENLLFIGYVGAVMGGGGRAIPDWTHFNSVVYHPELDQIAVTVPSFGEAWIIDHGTTTAE